MRAKCLIPALVLSAAAALLFAGCADSAGEYINLESMESESIETEGNTKAPEEISGYDDSPYTNYATCSYNSAHICGGMIDTLQEVDIPSLSYKFLCSRVGCNHRYDDACELNQDRSGVRYYNGGLLYTSEDSLYFRSSYGEIKKLHTNTYSTEFSQKNYPVTDKEPWAPRAIGSLVFLNEEELLVIASNYVYVYDLQSKKAGDPIEICDSVVIGVCVNGNEVYSYDMNGRAYLTSLEDGTSKLILEKGSNIKLLNGRLWYAVWLDGTAQIRSNNLELTDERIEAESQFAEFTPCEEGILYFKRNGGNEIVMLHTFDGEDTELLNGKDLVLSAGKDGYEYELTAIGMPMVYIGGRLYINCVWNGMGENYGENDEAIVWYCVENGEITELTEE
ncbi:MAG: hypothetical protein NC223_11055 [Butyrivibrio sp.]|nr:hypothetical protein [Butyrivibrio sp.]